MANPHIKRCPTSPVTRKHKFKQGANTTHLSECPKSKSQNQTKDVELQELSFLADGNTKRYSHSARQFGSYLTKLNPLSTESCHQMEAWKLIHTNTCARRISAQMWKQPRYPSWGDGQTEIYPYNGIFSAKWSQLSNREMAWRHLKCIQLSERSHCERLHTTWFQLYDSGKGKAMERVKPPVMPEGR